MRYTYSSMRKLLFIVSVLIGILFTYSAGVYALSGTTYELPSSIELTKGWEYRIGDSPMNDNNLPDWIFNDSPDWKPFKYPGPPNDIKGHNIVWLRIKLPSDISFKTLGLYIKSYNQYFEAYLEGKLIYRSGPLDPTGKIKSYNRAWSCIRLVPKFQDSFLYLRMYSISNNNLGIFQDAKLGDLDKFIPDIFKQHMDMVVLTFFFIFVSSASMLFFFIRKKQETSFLSLSFLSMALVFSTFASSQVNYLITEIPYIFWFYLLTISVFLIPAGICAFLEHLFNANFKLLCRRLWQGYILYAILAFTLDLSNLVSLLHTLNVFFLIALLTIPVILCAVLKYSNKRNLKGILIIIGITAICISGLYDLLGAIFKIIPWSHSSFPLGVSVFIIMLVFTSSRQYIDIHDKLKIYSEEIEIKNATINEKNAHLEERTEQLESINFELMALLDEIQHTQKQLIQSEKMAALGGLVAGVAHEINTPLGVSITATSFLQQQLNEFFDLYNSGKLKKLDFVSYMNSLIETGNMIMYNIQRASDFVRSFKQIAVDQSNEEKREFNIKRYIEEVLFSLRPKLKKTKHTITVYCADDIEIDSYPGAFSQIITNLIMNSLIHAYDNDDKGNIVIHVAVKDGKLLLKYSDDGKGIDSQIVDKIFDPFFTTKRGQGGTGLGLNIVFNIVNQTLSGNINCESLLGKGTTFIIEFPLDEYIDHEQ